MIRKFIILGLSSLLSLQVSAQFAGQLDSTFNGNGKVSNDFGFQDNLKDVKIQPMDQKVLAVGTALNSSFSGECTMVRLNTNGSYDTTFGTNGKIVWNQFTESYWEEAAIRSDGKILVAGSMANGSFEFSVMLARLKPDGSPDSTFGTNGIVTPSVGTGDEFGYAMIEQKDKKILVTGTMMDTLFRNVPMVMRFTEAGVLDSTFGVDGIATIPIIEIDNELTSIALQSDDKIVVSGHYSQGLTMFGSDNFDGLVARFNKNGSLDSTFGTNGVVITPVSTDRIEDYFGLQVSSDAKILNCGFTTLNDLSWDVLMTRYLTNGQLDTTFGSNHTGVVTFHNSIQDVAYDLELQADGKILVGGSSGTGFGGSTEFLVTRYNTNGRPDSTFGTNAVVLTMVDTVFSECNGLALQADNKIVATGKTQNGMNNDIALVRYRNNFASSLESVKESMLLNMYPNPLTLHSELHMSYLLQQEGNIDIRVLNLSGRMVASTVKGHRNAGVHNEIIQLRSGILPGLYIVQILKDGRLAKSGKLVVQE